MKDIPIIFSGPMVRALFADRKTMTRRLAWGKKCPRCKGTTNTVKVRDTHPTACPRCRGTGFASSPWQRVKPGDRLWVRESHSLLERSSFDVPPVWYWSDGNVCPMGDYTRPRPSIHMHRAFSRLTLIVMATKIERLQDISEADAIAEGSRIPLAELPPAARQAAWSERQAFKHIWGALHGPTSWDANHEVVALTFRVIKANIDAPEALAA